MPVRFLHLADLHLGASFRMLGPREGERRQDLLDAFGRAVDFALDPTKRIDAVLVAGDVFDRHDPPQALVIQVKAQTQRLADAQLPVYWIPGTHDRYDDPACVYRHDDLPGVTLFTEPRFGAPLRTTLADTPVAISGYAFQHGLSSPDPLADLVDVGEDVVHVAMLHGTVGGSLHWTVQDHYVPVTTADIARAPVQYLALGHYHNPQQWPTARGAAYYPGTLEGRRFGENGERLLTVVELDAGAGAPRIETHPWNRRTLRDEELRVDLAGVSTVEDVVGWITERATADTILRVRMTGTADSAIDTDAVHAAAAPACFHLEVQDDTDVFDSAWVSAFAGEKSVRGEFVRRLQRRLTTATEGERAVLAQALRLGVHAFANHANAAR